MNFAKTRSALTSVVAAGAVLSSVFWAQPASASLVGPVTVSLLSPGGLVTGLVSGDVIDTTPIALTQVAALNVGITPAGSGDISGFMLPLDSITFSGDSILLRVAAGTQLANGAIVSGYLGLGGAHARYVFDGLAIQGASIAGAAITTLGGASGAGGQLTAPGRFEFFLDELLFTPIPGVGSGDLHGDFRIDLRSGTLTPPGTVDEPGGAALVLLALAALRLVPRRRA